MVFFFSGINIGEFLIANGCRDRDCRRPREAGPIKVQGSAKNQSAGAADITAPGFDLGKTRRAFSKDALPQRVCTEISRVRTNAAKRKPTLPLESLDRCRYRVGTCERNDNQLRPLWPSRNKLFSSALSGSKRSAKQLSTKTTIGPTKLTNGVTQSRIVPVTKYARST